MAAEDKAKADRRGPWRTVFEPPWAFRARRWAEAGSQAPGGCAITGNISRKGERIQHTPWGDRFHERTRIDEILVFVAPVLLGDGTPLFRHPGGTHVALEEISSTPGPTPTVWLRVRR